MSSRRSRKLPEKPPEPPSNKFGQLSWEKKVALIISLVVLGLTVVTFVMVVVFDRLPVIRRWISPPDVRIGAAFYAYERGWTVDGKIVQTFSTFRNLPTNCYFWQVPARPLSKSAKIFGLHSQVLSKFRFENISDQRITNLRMTIASPLLNQDTVVSATPNVEAKGKVESMRNDMIQTYVVSIEAVPPRDVAILSLETPMDDTLRRLLYDEHRKIIMPVVSFSADQLGKLTPPVAHFDASTMYQSEIELRTGDKGITFFEKVEVRMLGPSEPEPNDESHRLLPEAILCKEGTSGNW